MLDTAPKMGTTTPAPQRAESNLGRWMALTAALLGWMFDGFEMGLFPLIGGPALNDLLGPSSAAQATQWFGAIIAVFLVGAATGGTSSCVWQAVSPACRWRHDGPGPWPHSSGTRR